MAQQVDQQVDNSLKQCIGLSYQYQVWLLFRTKGIKVGLVTGGSHDGGLDLLDIGNTITVEIKCYKTIKINDLKTFWASVQYFRKNMGINYDIKKIFVYKGYVKLASKQVTKFAEQMGIELWGIKTVSNKLNKFNENEKKRYIKLYKRISEYYARGCYIRNNFKEINKNNWNNKQNCVKKHTIPKRLIEKEILLIVKKYGRGGEVGVGCLWFRKRVVTVRPDQFVRWSKQFATEQLDVGS